MMKNIIILVCMIFMVKAYSQVKKTPLVDAEVNSTGLFEVANLRCLGSDCIADGKTFMLPFTLEVEGTIDSIDIANAELYLTQVIREEFNSKLKAFDYKGGLKLFGIQTEALGVDENSTRLLSLNVVQTEYVEYIDLSSDGKIQLVFNIYGNFGISKLTNQFDRYSPEQQDLIEQEHGVIPQTDLMNNAFGTKVDVGASVVFLINKLEVTGYARAMGHTSNNLFGGRADSNGLVNQTKYNTVQLGLDFQYNVYTSKNGGQLYLFANAEYGSYQHSLYSGKNGVAFSNLPPAGKELTFRVGVRYTLGQFKRRGRPLK